MMTADTSVSKGARKIFKNGIFMWLCTQCYPAKRGDVRMCISSEGYEIYVEFLSCRTFYVTLVFVLALVAAIRKSLFFIALNTCE
jgi:hypothetical protein